MNDDHLAELLTRGRTAAERDEGGGLPQASKLPDRDRDYKPFSPPSNKPLYTLHVGLGRDGYRSFQYVHIDSESSLTVETAGQVAAAEHVIRLRFCGSKTLAVIIRGRNLWRLYDYIHQHRIDWVMRVDPGRDFTKDDDPVITSIAIEEVKPPPSE